MNARWWWIGYALAVTVVLAAMGWFTATVCAGHAAERRAERAAFADDTARLALWRMDSRLATVIAREAGRPYLAYNAFYPATGALGKGFDNYKQGEVIVPSPLLGLETEEVLLHVQYAADGVATSPQIPVGELRQAAVPLLCSAVQVTTASERLADFTKRVTRDGLDAALIADPATLSETTTERLALFRGGQPADQPAVQQGSFSYGSRSGKELVARNSSFQSMTTKTQEAANRQEVQQGDYAQNFNDAIRMNGIPIKPDPNTTLHAEIMRPLWLGDRTERVLVLARRVRVGTGDWLQACWLDWPLIRKQLLGSIRDLLPEADLVPVTTAGAQPHRLATLPLLLTPGTALPDWQDPPPASNLPLLGAWAGVIAALVAGGVLLGGALALSERRGAFVSAVTHELRTPLTTFRLYTDLLAEGHVVDEAERQRCLDTLRSEAERLGHLVENVLGYARLERASLPTVALGIAVLIDGMQSRLKERAQRVGLDLVIDVSADVRPLAVRGEAQAIERILVNLVDNACKYAAAANDRRLHLTVARQAGLVTFTVRDHGPGIAPDLRRRLFTPFAKSAAEAATSAPGIGLGLALSQRLARQLGGDLRCEAPADGGAAFVLELPSA
ncbi:MAG: HAMP domain-containing histidine kinase [Planctomycetes bacterium]|jgi:signal transduction histidine kinase|nr:HAMP domain-containing histidine kinase [Planctomycetota bacterium]